MLEKTPWLLMLLTTPAELDPWFILRFIMLASCDAVAVTEWAAANGAYIHTAVHAGAPFAGKGLGMQLRSPVDHDEVLLHVPRKLLIVAEPDGGPDDAPDGVDTPRALCRQLLSLHAGGADAFWQPYLACLPRTFESTIYWSEPELRELQASPVKVMMKLGTQV